MSDPLVFTSPSEGVLVAPAHCGLLAVPDFLNQVQAWCSSPTGPGLVVDLSGARTFRSGTLRALLWARRHCLERGLRMAVVMPPEGLLRPLEATLLNDLFKATGGPGLESAQPVPTAVPETDPVRHRSPAMA